ncbi:acylphosphatase [Patescibacteria group bacterium]|nr:acylphosphatase [Patescibacteria group bacterium]
MIEEVRAHPPKFSKEKFGRAHIFVSGRVQGVFFRENTREKAEELGVFGWVKNLADGRVEAVFEGEKEKVESLIEWAKKGPEIARVNDIDVEWQEYKGEFKNFDIRYS